VAVPMMWSKRSRSAGVSGRDSEVRVIPRFCAACCIRGSLGLPSWYDHPFCSYLVNRQSSVVAAVVQQYTSLCRADALQPRVCRCVIITRALLDSTMRGCRLQYRSCQCQSDLPASRHTSTYSCRPQFFGKHARMHVAG